MITTENRLRRTFPVGSRVRLTPVGMATWGSGTDCDLSFPIEGGTVEGVFGAFIHVTNVDGILYGAYFPFIEDEIEVIG